MEKQLIRKLKDNKKLLQLIRFVATGFLGLIIDFSITWLFKDYFHINKYLANGLGFSFAVVNNYGINKIWTFKDKEKAIAKQFLKFLLISIIGLFLNTLFLYIILQKMNLSFYISKFLVVILVFIWNYTLNSVITFKKS